MADTTLSTGHPTVTPYLIVPGVARLLDFLRDAFDAQEVQRVPRPDGAIMHAHTRIGASPVMMGEPKPGADPFPASLFLLVEDCDRTYRRALDCGAASVMEPADQPHAGQRQAGVKDPSGNVWWIATRL
jgi:PhnB protein